jgi:protein NRD1
VGFGPRDCSDYVTGVSIIPIDRLTDADLKWVVSAEYGGTGGRPLEAGMIMEEPDIEIGAGVSSKAISQKLHLRGYQDRNTNNRRPRREEETPAPPRQQYAGQEGAPPPMFPPFPMMPGQPGGMFPPFMMTPQMQAFFQQQFGGGGAQGQFPPEGGFQGGFQHEQQGDGGGQQ